MGRKSWKYVWHETGRLSRVLWFAFSRNHEKLYQNLSSLFLSSRVTHFMRNNFCIKCLIKTSQKDLLLPRSVSQFFRIFCSHLLSCFVCLLPGEKYLSASRTAALQRIAPRIIRNFIYLCRWCWFFVAWLAYTLELCMRRSVRFMFLQWQKTASSQSDDGKLPLPQWRRDKGKWECNCLPMKEQVELSCEAKLIVNYQK